MIYQLVCNSKLTVLLRYHIVLLLNTLVQLFVCDLDVGI